MDNNDIDYDAIMAEVPRELHETFLAIVGLTDEFCCEYLDEDYFCLCRDMAIALCQKGSPVQRGKPASWASGIVHALGMVNFLSDPDLEPYMAVADIAKGFGVSQGTMTAKSKIIRDGLEMIPFDPQWCTADMLTENPLVWMVEVDGLIVDARDLPLAAQQKLVAKGDIPFVYDAEDDEEDWDDDEDDDDKKEEPEQQEPTILKFPDLRNENNN